MNEHKHKQNVDPDELKKFSDLASRWWDKNSEFKPLHEINPLRLNYIDQRSPLIGKRVLDIGCGGGILAESMVSRGAIVKGIDLAQASLSVAQLHALEHDVNVDYEMISAEELATKEAGKYDIVTCLEMLEHVPDPAQIVQACHTLVKPGGQVYFSTINRNPKSFLFAIVGAEYILNMLPKGTHQYDKFIRPSELGQWAEDAGLNIKEMIGLHYNPIFKSYSLAPGVDVNYMMYTQKEGVRANDN